MGVKHFCIGWDVRILHNWWKVNGEGMRAMIDGATGASKSAAPAAKEKATTY
jgi:4-hydroxy-2-oxoheptanedioate aldolase